MTEQDERRKVKNSERDNQLWQNGTYDIPI